MTQLKRWESPRRSGRNDKGKGGTARARQLRKQQQQLRQKLKSNQSGGEGGIDLPSFFYRDSTKSIRRSNSLSDRDILVDFAVLRKFA